jgi:cytochrome P450
MSNVGNSALENEVAQLAQTPNSRFPGIPGRKGLPLVGDAISFFKDTLAYQRRCYEEFGPVFYSRMGPEYNVTLCHPDAAKLTTLDTEKNFSALKGYENNLARLFPNGLLLRDFSDHKMHRRIMQSAFKNDRLESYMPAIHQVVRKHVGKWQQADEVSFVGAIKDCLLEVGSKVFLGMELGKDADAINQHFIEMVSACSTPVRFNIPGTQFNRGMKGYQYISDYFRSHIEEKRASDGTDMFSLFCKQAQEDGSYFSDDDIVHHVNFLLFAAHDTTTSTLSSMVYEFIKHPEWMEACRQELQGIDSDTLSYKQLSELENTSNCFKETLRLFPPVNSIARRSIRDFEFMGHTIPANTMVVVPHLLNMRLPLFFTNPDEFDPARFAPPREEHKAHSFAWFPFGGGAHKCIGLHFAEMLVKVTLFELLRSSNIEGRGPLASIEGGFEYVPFPKPRNNLPVKISARA